MVRGERDAGPHPGRRPEHAIQPGHVHHLDDGADPAAFLADQPRDRLVVLDLGRRVRPVAELVLEPLQVHAVPAAVRQHPGEQEAGQPAGSLREYQEHVAHGGRREPLVPGQQVAAVTRRDRPGGVGPDVGAALLLGHRHARQQAPLGPGRTQAEVVFPGDQQRFVLSGQLRCVPERGHDGVGHRDRAAVPGVGAAPDVEARGPRHVRAGALIPPRRGVQAVPDRDGHQLMPGRVELHLVDAMAKAVVGPQHRRLLVRLTAPLLRLGRAGQAAELAEAVLGPARALAAQRVEHRGIRGDVVPGQRRRLVEHLVGRWHVRFLLLGHPSLSGRGDRRCPDLFRH